ncbi:MAG: hypothetical protein JST92_21070 [Deltaproteobacteria bacterium]|nr:hypothetical protein [Deltaproteobacteria bacterium]
MRSFVLGLVVAIVGMLTSAQLARATHAPVSATARASTGSNVTSGPAGAAASPSPSLAPQATVERLHAVPSRTQQSRLARAASICAAQSRDGRTCHPVRDPRVRPRSLTGASCVCE